MVEAEYRLVTEGLQVNHLRLVMGTSMGGMHTWLWASRYPDFADAWMPLASLPGQISGRNRAWRRVVIDAIRNDPAVDERGLQDPAARACVPRRRCCGWLAATRCAARRKRRPAPTPTACSTRTSRTSSRPTTPTTSSTRSRLRPTTIPRPALEKITAPLLAINSADDLINPPELGILEREIKRVPKGRAIVLPLSDRTAGHGTHTLAAVWKQYLVELLKQTEQEPPTGLAKAAGLRDQVLNSTQSASFWVQLSSRRQHRAFASAILACSNDSAPS